MIVISPRMQNDLSAIIDITKEDLSSVARRAKEDRASGYRALYSGLEDRCVSLNTYARRIGIPCWSCTSLYGFANRRLGCSANGIEMKSTSGDFRLRPHCCLFGVLER